MSCINTNYFIKYLIRNKSLIKISNSFRFKTSHLQRKGQPRSHHHHFLRCFDSSSSSPPPLHCVKPFYLLSRQELLAVNCGCFTLLWRDALAGNLLAAFEILPRLAVGEYSTFVLPVTVKTAIVAVDQGTSMEKSADVQENYLNGNQFDSFSSSSASLRHVNYRYSSSLFS